MLMRGMRRTTWILVLLVAVSIAAEPLVHTHPLTHPSADVHSLVANDSGLCAICATAAARAIPDTPALAVPITASWSLFVAPVARLPRPAHADLSSRAPPAA